MPVSIMHHSQHGKCAPELHHILPLRARYHLCLETCLPQHAQNPVLEVATLCRRNLIRGQMAAIMHGQQKQAAQRGQ
jgi:hypothetical protein